MEVKKISFIIIFLISFILVINSAEILQIGELIKKDNVIITLESARFDKGKDFYTSKNGYSYCILDFLIENNNQEEIRISSVLQFYLKDKDGNKYQQSLMYPKDSQLDGKVLGNDKLRGSIIYEINLNSQDLKAYFDFNYFGNNQTVIWNIGNPIESGIVKSVYLENKKIIGNIEFIHQNISYKALLRNKLKEKLFNFLTEYYDNSVYYTDIPQKIDKKIFTDYIIKELPNWEDKYYILPSKRRKRLP